MTFGRDEALSGFPRQPVAVRRAVFLDRDGVLNEVVLAPGSDRGESPLSVGDVRLVPGAGRDVRRLQDAGWLVVCVTNQPAAAKGEASMEDLAAVQDRIRALVAAHGGRFDAERICLHHPDGVVPELSGPCGCRKPAPGMLLSSAAELGIDLGESWIVGDTDTDMEAGLAAGVRTALVCTPATRHKRSGELGAHVLVSSLAEAVDAIVSDTPR